jgi:hypothetical protein
MSSCQWRGKTSKPHGAAQRTGSFGAKDPFQSLATKRSPKKPTSEICLAGKKGEEKMGRTALTGLVSVGIFLAFSASQSFADERCKRLEELNRQYAGVQLTSTQKQLKKKLVSWYMQNCRTRRANATH